ncbi:TonB-dependent receptor [Sphingomonas crocodyli]|uniref:TonB-dependent receptor n=1 Tax=Sphingomonas crocodyli TaxID=1979270 RepID=A0A437M176_9SPHN|nr:TonB-dependent receptor [Sphingomonas crocodyli]RVT91274.1 TonB-dependent receptor [Sphingomonas crocodyli]
MMRRFKPQLFLALGAITAAASPAAAQTAVNAYPASFFTPFSPANALEIVRRVPGFVIEKVDEDIRGFSQAAGNVVINGQRPISKSDSIEVILSRIPANRVVRVEVGSGERFGSEYTAKAQVLNLVLSDAGGIAGTAEGTIRRDFRGRLTPEASLAGLLRRGKSTFNLSAQLTNGVYTEEGFDRITTLPAGTLREFRDKVNTQTEPTYALSGSWAYDGGTNRTAHLNARIAQANFKLDQRNNVFPATGPARNDALTQRFDVRRIEIGGDVTRPLAGGGIKLVGLATRRDRDLADTIFLRANGASLGGNQQTTDDVSEETLARLSWNRANLLGWSVEIGGEAALNKLDSDVGLFDVTPGGTRNRIDLPIDQAVVKEKRGELFINAGRPITKTLRADLGFTYEASRLTVSGDAQAERTLRFPKPKVTIDWRPRGGWHAQLSVSRTVAQLQFEDFISSATLAAEQINGGNANLVPQRAWEVLATIERPILGDGLIKIELGHDKVQKVQDRVPTPEGFDAPGNLGNGDKWIARAKVDAPLKNFGIKGGRLTLYGSYVGTSVVDPYTLEKRPFSNFDAFYFEINFRQDLGKFAWGVDAEGNTHSTTFRRNERDRFSRRNPDTSVFVEYRPTGRTTLNLTLNNITQAPSYRRRTFFFPDRTNPDPGQLEIRQRNRHILPTLKIKHSFG